MEPEWIILNKYHYITGNKVLTTVDFIRHFIGEDVGNVMNNDIREMLGKRRECV